MVFVMVVQLEIREECVEEFLQIMTADAKGSREEPGCLRFDLLKANDAANKFVLYEAYENDGPALAGTAMPQLLLLPLLLPSLLRSQLPSQLPPELPSQLPPELSPQLSPQLLSPSPPLLHATAAR